MHMADALISPAVGGAFWVVAGALIARSARVLKKTTRDDLVPMMGVMGAFVFAAQMINFSIPGTGSSGHLGGGLMLALLVGPHASLLVIASVLAVQALFFADGGLLALGCNIVNLGFFPAMVAWPLFRHRMTGPRGGLFIIAAAVTGLLLGSLAVVAQTMLSGISELSAGSFTLMMVPVHLAIGVVEGVATAAVVGFVYRARPAALSVVEPSAAVPPPRSVLVALLLAAAVLGGALSWFASAHPDGLEWSITRTAGVEEITGAESPLHERLASAQKKTALFPDYGFATSDHVDADEEVATPAWPVMDAGTSVSGLVGGGLTMGLILLLAFPLLRKRAEA